MLTDEDIIESVDLDELTILEIYELGELEEVERYNPLDAYQVRCKQGCGCFYLSDVQEFKRNEDTFSLEFRCPSCNEWQTGHLIILE